MGSLLELANMEVPEPKAVPEGEYPLQIIKADFRNEAEGTAYQSGREGYDILMKITNDENAALFYHRLFLNREGDKDTTVQSFARQIQQFMAAFEISDDDPMTWAGKTAEAILKLESGTEEYPEDKNAIKRFVKRA